MRGFWHTFEAVFGIIIMLTFLFFITSDIRTDEKQENLNLKANQLLKDLDEKGRLRSYVGNGNHSGLNSEIQYYYLNHSVQICSRNTCNGTVPSADQVWTGSYFVAGDNTYKPRVVKLYLYR